MSKAGKRLIKALDEVIASTKCAHDWKVKVQKSKIIKTCRKCGIRMYTFHRPA
jgi:predicted  nucleic acid-binding Zn-ribbon protein